MATEIENQIDLVRVWKRPPHLWDGGWLFGGLLGHGDAFLCRDAGIRPGFVLERDSFVAAASERAALATVFNAPMDEIAELTPGEVLEIKRSGAIRREAYTPQQTPTRCTFERIYFSRGNDPDIHRERIELGERLAPKSSSDWETTCTTRCFLCSQHRRNSGRRVGPGSHQAGSSATRDQLWNDLNGGTAKREQLDALVEPTIRVERLAHKDQRMHLHRQAMPPAATWCSTFTTSPVICPPGSTLVMLDAIVRGTTLRESIVAILGPTGTGPDSLRVKPPPDPLSRLLWH